VISTLGAGAIRAGAFGEGRLPPAAFVTPSPFVSFQHQSARFHAVRRDDGGARNRRSRVDEAVGQLITAPDASTGSNTSGTSG
jgi:hypothetical protein